MGLHSVTEVQYLSRSVHNLRCVVLAVVLDNPAEGILDRGVVAFHKMLLDKADSERGLAYRSRDRLRSTTVQGRVQKETMDRSLTHRATTDDRDLSLLRCGGHLNGRAANYAAPRRGNGKRKWLEQEETIGDG